MIAIHTEEAYTERTRAELEQRQVNAFRAWTLALFEGDTRFTRIVDMSGETRLDVLFEVAGASGYAVTFEHDAPGVRVGFITQDRRIVEAIERGRVEQRMTLTELLTMELAEMGETDRYEIDEIIQRPWFGYHIILPLASIAALESDTFRLSVHHALDAFHLMFQDYVDAVVSS